MTTSPFTLDRQLVRTIVAEIAEKAKATLPEANGRVDKAVALVLNGDVDLLPDGTARVYSQSNGITSSLVVNGHCDCQDFARAPSQWCKHRIAHGIQMRVQARLPQPAATDSADHPQAGAQSLPEAPASVNVRLQIAGRECQLTLRDVDEWKLLARLEEVLQKFPQTSAQASIQPPADATPQCPTHGAMKPSTKGSGWYCPHKNAEGAWCPHKHT
jgi:hypothetical protein